MPRKMHKGSKANQALRKVNKLARDLKPELKAKDINSTEFPVVLGSVVYLTGIELGTEDFDRIGSYVTMKSLEFRYTVSRTTTGAFATLPQIMRVMIVRRKDIPSGGVIPGITEFLETANYDSPIRHIRANQFSVLYDKTINLPSSDNSSRSEVVRLKNNVKANYVGDTDLIGSAGRNHLFLVCMANSADATAADNPSIKHYTRARYIDM